MSYLFIEYQFCWAQREREKTNTPVLKKLEVEQAERHKQLAVIRVTSTIIAVFRVLDAAQRGAARSLREGKR